jgi:hypothetical protein
VNPNGTFANSGVISVAESATGSFTTKLTLGGKTFAAKGSFDPFGSALVTIPRKGLSTLAIGLQLDDSGLTLAGHVYDSAFDSTFTGQASFYDGKTRLYPQPGPFTMATLPTTNSSGIPQGIGFATIAVATNGTFTIKGGQLGDSSTYTGKGFIAKNGEAQIYVLLYKNQGSLAGVVNFRSLATTDADGALRWLRPANVPKPKFFVPGFDTTLTFNASFYTKPAANTHIDSAFDANSGAAKIELRNGNLQANTDVLGTLDTKNKLTATTPVALTLNGVSGTGALNGSFTPAAGKKTAFKGVFLQKSNQAVGQFFGASASGSVTVKPN